MNPQRPFRITAPYLLAVAGITSITAIAWLCLWRVTSQRTHDKDYALRSRVGQIWGGEHKQVAPKLVLQPDGAGSCSTPLEVMPQQTRARVHLELDHRRKGLLWYSTYRVRFHSSFVFANETSCTRAAKLLIPWSAQGAIYDDFSVQSEGQELPFEIDRHPQRAWAHVDLMLSAGERRALTVRYNSRGLDSWSYLFGTSTSRARDFMLVASTNFSDVDFPLGTLSPTRKRQTEQGWELTWQFGNILADANIALQMPDKLNPGPLAAEISLFAPVSLAFFFLVLLLVSVIKQVRLHPVHYAMLAAAFFSFHLLLAYLVDHVPLWLAFCLSSVVSVGLVTSYLRLAVGVRFALLWAGGAQLLYLVLFSLAFFLEGYTGLTITIFSILTLFMIMQLTGGIDWEARFGRGDPRPHRSTLDTDPADSVFTEVS